jgi:TorA maturation chaperone TorD
MSSIPVSDQSNLSMARSIAYGLLATGFGDLGPQSWASLMEPTTWNVWPDILADSHAAAVGKLKLIRDRVRFPGGSEEAQSARARLFGHTARGVCPLYELEFGRGEVFQKSADLSDLQGFYSAFGLEIPIGRHERADYLPLECEFMQVLSSKEACLIENNDEAGVEIVRGAQRTFLEAHLGHWLPAFGRMVHERDPEGFHGALADFAIEFISAECERLGAACGPGLIELRNTDEEQETTMECVTSDFGAGCALNPPR